MKRQTIEIHSEMLPIEKARPRNGLTYMVADKKKHIFAASWNGEKWFCGMRPPKTIAWVSKQSTETLLRRLREGKYVYPEPPRS